MPQCIVAQTTTVAVNESHTGFISATATITVTRKQWEKILLDSLVWHEYKPLVKNYMGKKIKFIRWQKSTGRVVVDFYGQDNIIIKKEEAVKNGLFKPEDESEPVKPATYIPGRPMDIFIDSPLYIGRVNNVRLDGPDITDIITPQNRVHIQTAGTENMYTATASIPGKAEFIFIDSVTGKVKYICHALVKRLPGDGPAIEPEVRLGNITGTADTAFLRKQPEMVITKGFTLAGGTAYFTGTGFKDVIIADIDKQLTYMKPFINSCMPGSQINVDDITVKDAAGKIYSVNSFSIKVTDNAFAADSVVDYYSLTTFPQFLYGEGSLENYVKQKMAADTDAVGQKVSLILKIEADGSVMAASNVALAAFSSLERKCFEIIKSGPEWTPGTYKGNNAAMTVTFYCEF